ncbi:hypothetical protein SmJEL517_g05273 [Synchytrium microbalum]|uniref:tRNA pseudouridine synthase n=1 Tax=Synchytrium microbalum TaxID=1806994 RepID=A0A507C035_9FUNG|nr:uncharacterized protein SmJEL517_g05273 [Synchytrium microbalum]TPX31414.1 hypothetical protein SmJEL517_g05273 [Synchytrium microbalum]
MKPSKAAKVLSAAKLRPFDFSSTTKRNVGLLISYHGAGFRGLARQPKYINTIEERIVEALITTRLIGPEINEHQTSLDKAARTDKGVSSSHNVVSLWLRSNSKEANPDLGIYPFMSRTCNDLPSKKGHAPLATSRTGVESRLDIDDASIKQELPYVVMLNRHLPPTIRILAWSPVSGFDARRHALQRTYEYSFPAHGIDLELLTRATDRFVGTHDFSYFTDYSKSSKTNIRTISEMTIREEVYGSIRLFVVTIKAPSFVWHQIRNMMTVLIRVGQGLESEEVITQMLETKPEKDAKTRPLFGMASPLPLILTNVEYPPSSVKWSFPEKNVEYPPSSVNWIKSVSSKKEDFRSRLIIEAQREEFRAVMEARFWKTVGLHWKNEADVSQNTVMWHDEQIVKSLRGSGAYVPILHRPYRPWGPQ